MLKRISYLLLTIVCYFCLSSITYAKNQLSFAINGIDGNALNNISSRLDIELKSFGDDLTQENIEMFYQRAPMSIRQALQPFGYFHPNIQSQLKNTGSNWVATFTVLPGAAIKINQVDITIIGDGKDNPELLKQLHSFPLKSGMDFKTELYTKTKEDLFQIANNQGYVKSFFISNKIRINLKTNKADIIMHFDTGHRYYFGEVKFVETPYAIAFLRRFIRFKENEPFSSQKLLDLQQKMSSSFFFRRVVITPDFKHEENYRVPIIISGEAQKSQKYNVGVGFGTFTGFRLTAGASFRRITDTGQHLDFQLRLSSVLSGLGIKYYIPGKNPIEDRWVIGANYQRFAPKKGMSISQTVSVGYTKKLHRIHTSTTLNYLIDRYRINNLNIPTQTKRLLYPSFNLSYVKSDSLIDPHFGKSINLTLQGATSRLFSSTNFLQTDIKGKYIFSPFSFSRVILRGELGYTLAHDIEALPLTMRFFAGGINSIRGYADSSIGPGKYLTIGSVEYQNRIVDKWSAAIFYDFGSASNHFGSPLKRGAGVGIVYQSLIGPIKLYGARALDRPRHPYSVEFSIGPEF